MGTPDFDLKTPLGVMNVTLTLMATLLISRGLSRDTVEDMISVAAQDTVDVLVGRKQMVIPRIESLPKPHTVH